MSPIMLTRSASSISLATIDPHDESFYADHEDRPRTLGVDDGTNSVAAGAALCVRCQNLDIQSFARASGNRKGYLLTDVRAAAKEGCEFCGLLLESLKDVEEPQYFYSNAWVGRTTLTPELYVHMTISEDYKETSSATPNGGLRANRLFVELGDRFSGVRTPSSYEMCIAADPASPAASNGDVLGRYIGNDPTSASHYETIQHWLQACVSHSKCSETVSGSVHIKPDDSPLPTRVIEIVREADRRCLYLREANGRTGAYITLTHRWNDATSKCITTTSNLESRKVGDGFGHLPQLFQDAFTIAEKLKVKFIWIDSICIIQRGDDYTDWRREAPKMAQYYQFSVFTLAGTAEDVTGGILRPYARDLTPWSSNLVRLPYRDGKNNVAGNFYCYIRRTTLVEEYMAQVRSSILLRRGWILQEWLLSKRLLWYTPHGLFFECQEEPPRAYDQSQLALRRASAELQAHLRLKELFHHTNSDILSFWYSVLEVYSGQELTKPSADRILAVAGLAAEVGSVLANTRRLSPMMTEDQNEVYVAGLWLRDIQYGLMWEQQHAASSTYGKVLEAPSWSWASLILPVRWPERSKELKSMLRVIGVCFERNGRHNVPENLIIDGHSLTRRDTAMDSTAFDPTNMFTCLHVRGRVHTVHIRGYLETKTNLKKAALSTDYTPIPERCEWRAVCSAVRPEIIAGWGSLEQLQRHPTACADFGTAVYALHVSTQFLRWGLFLKKSTPVLNVMFVEEVEQGSGAFRRLGVGRIADQALIAEFGEAVERDIQLV